MSYAANVRRARRCTGTPVHRRTNGGAFFRPDAVRSPLARPTAAESISNPATGERIAFRDRTEAALEFDYRLAPGGLAVGESSISAPTRRNASTSARGDSASGWTATPGTRFAVLRDTPHTVRNGGPKELHAVAETRPASEVAALFGTMYGHARAGRTNRWGALPGPLQLAVMPDEFREEFALAGVPVPIQRALLPVVAPAGRRAGYRAS